MTTIKISSAVLLFFIYWLCSFSSNAKDDSEVSKEVYLVAQISVKDHQEYIKKYGRAVSQLLTEAGAEILVASPKVEILEGEWSGNWTVISKFPSTEALKSWYNSEEYSLFKKMRVNKLTDSGNLIVLPNRN